MSDQVKKKERVIAEFYEVAKLALPAVATNVLSSSLQVVDQAFVGHIGPAQLAAAALGNSLFNMLWFWLLGVSTALDTLASQAHGAGDHHMVKVWTGRAAVVLTGCSIFMSAVLFCSQWVVSHIFQQSLEVAEMTGAFCTLLLPGLWFYSMFIVLQKYLQVQGVMLPSVWVGIIVNVVNAVANWVFIWKLGMGFNGSPIATSFSRLLSFLLLGGYVWLRERQGGLSRGRLPLRESLDARGLQDFLKLGMPGGVMLGLEAWSFEIQTVMAGLFGQIALDAHTVLLTVSGFTFLSFPFGISLAASIRVGNLLGAKQARQAKLCSSLCIQTGVGFMGLCGLSMFCGRSYMGYIFSEDQDVIQMTAKLAVIASCFQLCDGYQGVAGGVLRGMGHQARIAVVNMLAFWAVGIPLGAFMAFKLQMGVFALWLGLTIGLTGSSIIYFFMLMRTDWEAESMAAVERATNQSDRVPSPTSQFGTDRLRSSSITSPTLGRAKKEMPMQRVKADSHTTALLMGEESLA